MLHGIRLEAGSHNMENRVTTTFRNIETFDSQGCRYSGLKVDANVEVKKMILFMHSISKLHIPQVKLLCYIARYKCLKFMFNNEDETIFVNYIMPIIED